MTTLWLGTVEYAVAWQLQRELAVLRAESAVTDTLLLLEHPPTITLGRGARREHVLASPDLLREQGVSIHEVDRGGDVTYHGPGQLVGYPILDLNESGRDLHRYLRDVEAALIELLAVYGVSGRRFPLHTGVWTEDRKIAAIGVKVSRWITSHGFALNVNTALDDFELIVPCGIRDYGVTSIAAETCLALSPREVAPLAAAAFRRVFGVCDSLERLDAARLSEACAAIVREGGYV